MRVFDVDVYSSMKLNPSFFCHAFYTSFYPQNFDVMKFSRQTDWLSHVIHYWMIGAQGRLESYRLALHYDR